MKSSKWLFLVAIVLPLTACNDLAGPESFESDGITNAEGPAGDARIEVPGDHPGNPFYAFIFNGLEPDSPHFFFPRDNGWGAVIFERNPACVPAEFNLLLEFDFPNAWGCGLVAHGFQIWHNPPDPFPVDPAPIMVVSKGLGAVPVLFARWDEIEAAMADAVLTLPELEALPSAEYGVAQHFMAQYVNGPEPEDRLMNKLTARGTLPDGRTFRIHANESQAGTRYQIDITQGAPARLDGLSNGLRTPVRHAGGRGADVRRAGPGRRMMSGSARRTVGFRMAQM